MTSHCQCQVNSTGFSDWWGLNPRVDTVQFNTTGVVRCFICSHLRYLFCNSIISEWWKHSFLQISVPFIFGWKTGKLMSLMKKWQSRQWTLPLALLLDSSCQSSKHTVEPPFRNCKSAPHQLSWTNKCQPANYWHGSKSQHTAAAIPLEQKTVSYLHLLRTDNT